MKKFTYIALLLIASFSFAQNKTFLDVSYMEMSATADSLVAPDRIYLSIFINEQDEKNKISVEELEAKMKQILNDYAPLLNAKIVEGESSEVIESSLSSLPIDEESSSDPQT